MSATLLTPEMHQGTFSDSMEAQIQGKIDDLMSSLPNPAAMTTEARRGMIARYTAVLEGNFIYWMTAAYLAVKCDEAKPIIIDNLREEVGDSHPVMLRKFAIAAGAFPTETDAMAVNDELNAMRLFLGKLSGARTLLSMAFFEGFIQKFMAYLAELAAAQGSSEFEYTDVHGVCDIAHTDGLFRAFALEMKVNPPASGANLFEGVELLEVLMRRVVDTRAHSLAS